jgi:hypothetical protein
MSTIRVAGRFSLIACCLLVCSASPAWAEPKPEAINRGTVAKWRTDYDTATTKLVETDLAGGMVDIIEEHKPKIELAARFYTASIKFFDPNSESEVHNWFVKMAELLKRGEKKDHHQDFLKIFAAQCAKTAQDLLPDMLPASRIQTEFNLARFMAMLAEYGQEPVVPVLVKCLELKPLNEAARYYGAKGLASFFALAFRPEKPVVIQDKKLQQLAVTRLIELLHNPEAVTDDAPEDRLDGFRMMRRELVRALAQTRLPLLKTEDGDLLIAFELARIMHGRYTDDKESDKDVVPRPRFDERAEAAIGLALMDSSKAENYDPDVAAFYLGKFAAEYSSHARGPKQSIKNLKGMQYMGLKVAEAIVAMRDAKSATPYQKKIADLTLEVMVNLEGGAKGAPDRLKNFTDDNGEDKVRLLFKDKEKFKLPGGPVAFPLKEESGEK